MTMNETSEIAYIEQRAQAYRWAAARGGIDTDQLVQRAIALEALASDLRAKLHEPDGEQVG